MPDYINCPKTGEAIDASSELMSLLAVICGDGGQWVQQFGIKAAIVRAKEQHYQMAEGADVIARIWRNITGGFDRAAEGNAFAYCKRYGIDKDTGERTLFAHVVYQDSAS